jgi:hypothetical protein
MNLTIFLPGTERATIKRAFARLAAQDQHPRASDLRNAAAIWVCHEIAGSTVRDRERALANLVNVAREIVESPITSHR